MNIKYTKQGDYYIQNKVDLTMLLIILLTKIKLIIKNIKSVCVKVEKWTNILISITKY